MSSRTIKDGNKVLAKVNDKFSPLISRGNAYITLPDAKDYTIECDVQGTRRSASDLPDIGVVANRYTLILGGNVQKLRLVSWDALPRIDKTVQFNWKPGVWYRLKLTTDIANGKGVIRGKAWPRDEKEPAEWTVEVSDSHAIGEGSRPRCTATSQATSRTASPAPRSTTTIFASRRTRPPARSPLGAEPAPRCRQRQGRRRRRCSRR